MIGCDCPVCTSSDARDKRTRPSLWIRIGTTHLLVDTAPELRLQCVANGIDRVDAVLFTHHHADHVTGLDDLRRFNWLMKKPMPCYGTTRTIDSLANMFSYAFSQAHDSPHSRPELALHRIDESPLEIGEAKITPIPMLHGKLPVLGFRFGPFADIIEANKDFFLSQRIQQGRSPQQAEQDVAIILDLLRYFKSLGLSTAVTSEGFQVKLKGSWK